MGFAKRQIAKFAKGKSWQRKAEGGRLKARSQKSNANTIYRGGAEDAEINTERFSERTHVSLFISITRLEVELGSKAE